MRRRNFIALLGSAAAWPLAARAQQAAMPVVGLLSGGASDDSAARELLPVLRHGLSENGYIEGQNVAIEYRWADFQNDRLPGLAADLVKRSVDVIVTYVGTSAGLAAKAATSSIPIVVITGDDLVRVGLVASLNRPGGNVTGVSAIPTALGPKRLELLRGLMPKAGRIGLLVNVNSPDAEVTMQEVPAAARRLGQEIIVATAGSEAEIDAAFAMLARRQVGALLVGPDPFFGRKVAQLVAVAARHRLPTMYWRREFVAAGGLISYGAGLPDSYRQAGVYAGRILRGARPADLPVMQPTRFELVINLKTAKTLALEVPPLLLTLADEVIE
jgi:putative tryptophan/tyrosine transport system substrate-binding protein